MKALSVSQININAPYKVWNEGKLYRFETDFGISYIVDFEKVFELKDTDLEMDQVREVVLNAPIFEGKCFWEVEKNLIWVDESCDGIMINDLSEIEE